MDYSTRTGFLQCHHEFSLSRHEQIYVWVQMLYFRFGYPLPEVRPAARLIPWSYRPNYSSMTNTFNSTTSRMAKIYCLPKCLPDETTPVTGWYDLWSLLHYGPKTNSSRFQILCRLFLKSFTDVTHTTSWSSLFHQFITRSDKKWWRRSVLLLFFFNLHGWPRV